MPSELDSTIRALLARHTAPGGLLETAHIERFGVQLPVFAKAPPCLPALFGHFSHQHADAEFLIDGDLRLSFGEVYAAASAVARALVAHAGVRPGAHVGLAARNSASWVVAFMGISMAGGCAVLLNGWWSGAELAEGVALADCALVLADEARATRMAGLTDARIVSFAHTHPSGAFAALGDAPADTPLPMPGADDPATILFTSGSTGGPKGALSDHRALVQAPLNFLAQSLVGLELAVMQDMVPPAQQSALMAVPLFHVTALITLLLQSFPIGRKLVMMPKWDAAEAMRLIEAEKITYFIGVPLMSHEIATHPDRARYDLATCVYFGAGGAPRPAAHVAIMRQNLPHAFPMLGYGLTETNAVGATNMRENYLAKPTSTGPASAPLSEVAILGADGQHLPAGQPGEIAIRSVCNMVGYWGNPQATAAALTPDGFFRSGDIGYLDEDGYLFIVDRAKDIVIRGGENITCQEVEAALYAHPGVAEAAVIAQADPRFGEVPVAIWVASDTPHAPSDDELHSFLAQHIAGFKIPAHFYRLDALPRLGTEKIDKQALKARFAAGAQPGMAGEPQ